MREYIFEYLEYRVCFTSCGILPFLQVFCLYLFVETTTFLRFLNRFNLLTFQHVLLPLPVPTLLTWPGGARLGPPGTCGEGEQGAASWVRFLGIGKSTVLQPSSF